MHARRTASRGTSAARATASTMTPSCAPWRSSPVSSATRKRCSGSVARAKSAASASRRAACDPGPAIAPIASHAASTSLSASVGLASPARAGRAASGSRRRSGAGAARRRGRRRAIATSSGSMRRSVSASALDLLRCARRSRGRLARSRSARPAAPAQSCRPADATRVSANAPGLCFKCAGFRQTAPFQAPMMTGWEQGRRHEALGAVGPAHRAARAPRERRRGERADEAGCRPRCWRSTTRAGPAARRCGRSSACSSIRPDRGPQRLSGPGRRRPHPHGRGRRRRAGRARDRRAAPPPSPGVQGGYVSNGCPECDALVGRFRVDDLLADHLAAGGALADLAVDLTVDLLGDHVWRGARAHAVGLPRAQCDALVRPTPGGAVGMHRVGDLLPARVAEVPARGGRAHAPHVRAAVAGDPARGLARAARQPAVGAVPRQRSRRRAALHGALLPARRRPPRRDLRRGAGRVAGGRVVAGAPRRPAPRDRRRGRAGRRSGRALRTRLRGAGRRRAPCGRSSARSPCATPTAGCRRAATWRARSCATSARRWCAPMQRSWPPCTAAERQRHYVAPVRKTNDRFLVVVPKAPQCFTSLARQPRYLARPR